MAPERSTSASVGRARTDDDQAPKATSPGPIARRSVSIFSRRGTDDPPARQNRWTPTSSRRSSSPANAPSRTSSRKRTVLHAVPAARKSEMTLAGEEMATSPHAEILSAISEHPPQLPAAPTDLSRTTKHETGLHPRSTRAPKTTSRSRRRSDNDHRIGTWINGIAHFDQSARGHLIPPTHSISRNNYPQLAPHSSIEDLNYRTNMGATTPPMLVQHPVPKRSYTPNRCERASTIVAPQDLHMEAPVPLPAVSDARLLTPEPQSAGQPRVVTHRSRPSQSSSSSRSMTDESSVYSRRSSMTTVDTIITPECRPLTSPSNFSLLSPIQAGVFDDVSPLSRVTMVSPCNVNKTLPPTPTATPAPSTTQALQVVPVIAPCMSDSLGASQDTSGSRGAPIPSRSMKELRCTPQAWSRASASSPTLSQAEVAVRSQLSAMGGQRSSWQSVDGQTNEQHLLDQALNRRDSVREVMQPPQRAPTLPKRSRKREWRAHQVHQSPSQQVTTPCSLARRRSEAQLVGAHRAKPDIPIRKMASISHVHDAMTNVTVLPHLSPPEVFSHGNVPGDVQSDAAQNDEDCEAYSPTSSETNSALASASTHSAEVVLLTILGSLQSLSDLFNTAVINTGMYRVYKEHEMSLIRVVIRNQSLAAYEYREWSHLEHEHEHRINHTPQRYLACHQRDVAVIQRLKRLVFEKCQSFLRRETVFALSTPMHPEAQRFDDAFWRIWCFCAMFSPGNRKGREDDITGQVDWLKGGVLNENQGCAATFNANLEFDMSSVLLNAPENFAIANKGGLSTAQLWDVTEIWNCCSVLLSGYSGRIQQARDHGIFDNCNVSKGDIENEERLLEEWLTYALTLGLDVVLALALLASDNSPAGFALAKQNGWTEWSLPIYNGSLCNFLKEPVAIIYSEQMAAAKLRLQDPREQHQKELSRKRVASMAAEIRLRRQSSEYKRLPLIDMKTERAMSVVSRRDSVSSMRSGITTASSRTRFSQSSTSTTPPAYSSLYRTPPQSINRILEDQPGYAGSVASSSSFSCHPQSYASVFSENTSEIATMKLVSMGFSATAARQALRITDDGESLHVDRAVDYLLRQR